MEEKSITVNPETASEQEKKKPRTKRQPREETPSETEKSGAAVPAEAETEAQPADEMQTASAADLPAEPDLGKFKSVDALMRAYRELEAEFTRRSQKLKALEETAPQGGNAEEKRVPRDEDLYRAVTENEGVRARVLSDYLSSLHGVPLMTGGGAGAKAPADKPKSIREAGNLALGYLRNQK